MLKLQVPFLLTDSDQIPDDLIRNGLSLEGSIFNGKDLADTYTWNIINKNLVYIEKKYGSIVHSLHFPTENANYLSNQKVEEYLYQFIEIAQKYKISTIVLHSNCFRGLSKFSLFENLKLRDEYVKYFDKLNRHLNNYQVKIGIENMPIIGDHGTDFDSIFVFPDDFKDLNFSNIGITWDIGHWAYTYFVINSLKNFSSAVIVKDLRIEDFLEIRQKIIHTHFSSFIGTTYPFSKSVCQEGIEPQLGTIDQNILLTLIKKIKNWSETITMTLEIKEKDYNIRKNTNRVVDWITNA